MAALGTQPTATPTTLRAGDAAGWAVVARLTGRVEELGERMVDRYCEEIVEYGRLGDDVRRDVAQLSSDQLATLLGNLDRQEVLTADELDRTRAAAAARVHQGVPLESFLHALRLWGRIVWGHVLEAADTECPEEMRASLVICGRVLEQLDLCSTAVTEAYLDEFQWIAGDRALLRRDLLEALVAGKGARESVQVLALGLGLPLDDAYAVVVARGSEPPLDEVQARPLPERMALRRVLDAARVHLRPPSGSLLLGTRQGEVVGLYPLEDPAAAAQLREQCDRLARAVAGEGVSVGIGGRQEAIADVTLSYEDARRAADSAVRGAIHDRAVVLDDVLAEELTRGAPHVGRLLDGMVGTLRDYDAQRQAELVPTLRAYLDCALRVSRTATVLCVHPNTVLYRLRRIKELSGRDPHDPEDLALLVLAMKRTGPA